jgi:hypothetical protein
MKARWYLEYLSDWRILLHRDSSRLNSITLLCSLHSSDAFHLLIGIIIIIVTHNWITTEPIGLDLRNKLSEYWYQAITWKSLGSLHISSDTLGENQDITYRLVTVASFQVILRILNFHNLLFISLVLYSFCSRSNKLIINQGTNTKMNLKFWNVQIQK